MEDAVNIEINSLRTYVDNNEEQLLSEVRRQGIIEQGKEKNENQMEYEKAYRNKAFHTRYFVATDNVRGSKSWEWLRGGGSQAAAIIHWELCKKDGVVEKE